MNNEFIFCELGCNTSYFEKCPPGVIVNNEFIFCELEKCPPGVIVNNEIIFCELGCPFPILRNVHQVLL
jgi:hypothetical protein